jgi:anti-anti-sigma factor
MEQSIEIIESDDYQIIKISGRLDLQVIYEQSKKVSEYPQKNTLVDLCAVEFIDSTGIGLLMNIARHVQIDGLSCILFGLNPAIMNTLKRTNLDKFFVISNDQESAASLLKH